MQKLSKNLPRNFWFANTWVWATSGKIAWKQYESSQRVILPRARIPLVSTCYTCHTKRACRVKKGEKILQNYWKIQSVSLQFSVATKMQCHQKKYCFLLFCRLIPLICIISAYTILISNKWQKSWNYINVMILPFFGIIVRFSLRHSISNMCFDTRSLSFP